MEVPNVFIIFCAVVLILYLLFEWKTRHMHNLTHHMPGIKGFPLRQVVEHIFAKGKERHYSE